MRHDIRLTGYRYMLRPVEVSDAEFIVDLRSNPQLNAFIHETSPRVEDQVTWMECYFERSGDWYFTVVDQLSGLREGVISIYNHDPEQGTAEWGRWIMRPGSLASLESALLMYRTAFEALGLRETYSRTIVDNKSVISFHDSCGAPRYSVLTNHFEIGGQRFDCVEHRVDSTAWEVMRPRLEQLAKRFAGSAAQRGTAC